MRSKHSGKRDATPTSRRTLYLKHQALQMTTQQMKESWKRTEGFLLDAHSHLSEIAEAVCADKIAEFHELIDHNELELALNALESVYARSRESYRVLELLALSAASMGLTERRRKFDEALTKARGWVYTTVLPQSSA
jgi:uncharacterized protein YgbK (DUF1537 family)